MVSFFGRPATDVVVLDASDPAGDRPPPARSGAVNVNVRNPGEETYTARERLPVRRPAAAGRRGRAPDRRAPQSGGTEGDHHRLRLRGGATVTFGRNAARKVNVVSSTRITAVTPAGPLGEVPVGVRESRTAGRPSSRRRSPTSRRPTITSVKPARGPVDGGHEGHDHGHRIRPDAVVAVGNVVLEKAKVVNDSTITDRDMPPAGQAHQGRRQRDESRSSPERWPRGPSPTRRGAEPEPTPTPTPTTPALPRCRSFTAGSVTADAGTDLVLDAGRPVPAPPPACQERPAPRGRLPAEAPGARTDPSCGRRRRPVIFWQTPGRGRARRHHRLLLPGDSCSRAGAGHDRRDVALTAALSGPSVGWGGWPHTPGDAQLTSMTESDGVRDAYDVAAIQERWLPVWDELAPFRSGRPDDDRPKKYVLDMFPYPSGDLHMGHAEAYALGDVVARYWVQRGLQRHAPDRLGRLRAAGRERRHQARRGPGRWTYENIEQQKASMRRYACSFDWDRVLNTCDPEYYRWNQWLFLRLFERGLAYRKDSAVNWCPNDQTVLANEQVVDGLCERCDTPVTKKKLTQWYFRITDYADRLLDDMEQLEGAWPEKVLLMQRNWIGRSAGADVDFDIEGRDEPVTVYTTRPDTLFGATFFVVAADSDLAAELAAGHAVRRPSSRSTWRRSSRSPRSTGCDSTAREDRRLPGAVRGQPGQRRADPDLGVRLRAGRLRHRRDHGRARPRPARPRLRARLRPAGARRRRRGRGPGGHRRRDRRRRSARELRPAGRARQGRGHRRDHRGAGGARHRARRPSTTGCATG